MELTTIFIFVIVLAYFMKNTKGKAVIDNLGETAVHLSSAANKASAALERQCNELLMSDEEAKAKSEAVKAKLAAASKAKVVEDNYDDAE